MLNLYLLLECLLKISDFTAKGLDCSGEFGAKFGAKLLLLIHFNEDRGKGARLKNCTGTVAWAFRKEEEKRWIQEFSFTKKKKKFRVLDRRVRTSLSHTAYLIVPEQSSL